jgi:hypothetical protein
MTVGVAIRGGGGSRAKLFLQFEERLEYFLIVMEIVVHDVDEHRIVQNARNELA